MWFREHAADLRPWWFSSGPGRFDLPLPYGTCYLTDDASACVRERVGPDLAVHGRVAASVLAGRVVSRLRLVGEVRAANLTSDRASDEYGVTAELISMTPYDVPQAWSDTLHRAGSGGIHGRVRFTVTEHRALAVFGRAGERDEWPVDPDPVPARVVAEHGTTITLVDPPDDDQVTVIGAP